MGVSAAGSQGPPEAGPRSETDPIVTRIEGEEGPGGIAEEQTLPGGQGQAQTGAAQIGAIPANVRMNLRREIMAFLLGRSPRVTESVAQQNGDCHQFLTGPSSRGGARSLDYPPRLWQILRKKGMTSSKGPEPMAIPGIAYLILNYNPGDGRIRR
jgi:hypothetical protein